jgi:hypothetical protein
LSVAENMFDAMSRPVLSSTTDGDARVKKRRSGQSGGRSRRSSPCPSETSANDWKQKSDGQKTRLR